jgi:hypothetical protein
MTKYKVPEDYKKLAELKEKFPADTHNANSGIYGWRLTGEEALLE